MIDIAHTTTGDVLFNGDFQTTESTDQHKKDILLADKGHYKETPEMGVGIVNYLQDTHPENLLRTTRKEFTKDGIKVERIGIAGGTIKVTGNYE